jgi:hypothetical protein
MSANPPPYEVAGAQPAPGVPKAKDRIVFVKSYVKSAAFGLDNVRANLAEVGDLEGYYVLTGSQHHIPSNNVSLVSIEVRRQMLYQELVKQLCEGICRPYKRMDDIFVEKGVGAHKVLSYSLEVVWEMKEEVTRVPLDSHDLSVLLQKMESRGWSDCFRLYLNV